MVVFCCYPTPLADGNQSFEFLVEVSDFKAGVPVSGNGNDDQVTQDFARYLAIVNSFIKYDSHLEINIGSDVKRDVMDYIKFEAYLMLGPVSCATTRRQTGLGGPGCRS